MVLATEPRFYLYVTRYHAGLSFSPLVGPVGWLVGRLARWLAYPLADVVVNYYAPLDVTCET